MNAARRRDEVMMVVGRNCGRSLFLSVAVAATFLSAAALADEEIIPYRLEITGNIHVRVAGSCRILKSAHRLSSDDRWVSFADQAPQQFDVSGAAVVCVVRKVKGDGSMTVTLRRGDGVPIAYYTLATRGNQLRVRSIGPWGVGGAKVLPMP